jgi:hypothetical protein
MKQVESTRKLKRFFVKTVENCTRIEVIFYEIPKTLFLFEKKKVKKSDNGSQSYKKTIVLKTSKFVLYSVMVNYLNINHKNTLSNPN